MSFLHEEGSKKEGIPSCSLDAGDMRTVLGLLSLEIRLTPLQLQTLINGWVFISHM